MYISIDESGILRPGQGNFFVVAAYVAQNRHIAERCMKKTRQILGKKSKQTEEIKFNNSKDTTIIYLFKKLIDSDFRVYYVPFDKRTLSPNIQINEQIIIKKLLKFILADVTDPCEIYIDNFLQGHAKKSFDNELKTIFKPHTIQLVNSNTYPEMQIADFLVGALHRHLCNPNDVTAKKCYEMIKERCTKIYR